MASQHSNANRFLISVIGFLLSVVSILGNREISKVENDSAAIKLQLENLRDALYRELNKLSQGQAQNALRIDSVEKFRDHFEGLEDGRGKQLGEIEGSIRVLTSEVQSVGRDVSKLEGRTEKTDGKEKR